MVGVFLTSLAVISEIIIRLVLNSLRSIRPIGFRMGTIDTISVASLEIVADSLRIEVDRSQIKVDWLKIASVVSVLKPVTIWARFSGLSIENIYQIH